MESKYQRGEKALKADVESLQKVKKVLIDEKKHIRFGEWNAFDIEVFFFYFKYFAVLWIRIVPDPNFFSISGFAFCFIQKTVIEKKYENHTRKTLILNGFLIILKVFLGLQKQV